MPLGMAGHLQHGVSSSVRVVGDERLLNSVL